MSVCLIVFINYVLTRFVSTLFFFFNKGQLEKQGGTERGGEVDILLQETNRLVMEEFNYMVIFLLVKFNSVLMIARTFKTPCVFLYFASCPPLFESSPSVCVFAKQQRQTGSVWPIHLTALPQRYCHAKNNTMKSGQKHREHL